MVDTMTLGGIMDASGRNPTATRKPTTQQQKYAAMGYGNGGYAKQMANFAKTNPMGTAYGTYSGANWSLPALGPNTQMQGPAGLRSPAGPGGGGRGGGGGGGGLTAAQQAAMARLMDPSLMGFTPFKPSEYTPFKPTPRDTAMYDAARKRISGAQAKDTQFATGVYGDAMKMLQGQKNVMANPQMTQTPQMQQAYQRLLGNGPGNQMVGNVINAENAYSQNSDGAFGNLMAILAQQEGRNMQSRQNQTMQDRAATLNAIQAQGSGMLGGVEMADLQDAKEYQRYLNDIGLGEHRYQADRTFGVEQGNWAGQLGVDQGNVGIQNDWAMKLMDLIPMLSDPGVLAKLGIGGAAGLGQRTPQLGAATVGTQAQRLAPPVPGVATVGAPPQRIM